MSHSSITTRLQVLPASAATVRLPPGWELELGVPVVTSPGDRRRYWGGLKQLPPSAPGCLAVVG